MEFYGLIYNHCSYMLYLKGIILRLRKVIKGMSLQWMICSESDFN